MRRLSITSDPKESFDQAEIEKQSKLPLCNYNMSPVHHACMRGNDDAAKFIIESFPENSEKLQILTDKDGQGEAAIHYAAKFNCVKTLQSIQDLCENPEVKNIDLLTICGDNKNNVLQGDFLEMSYL